MYVALCQTSPSSSGSVRVKKCLERAAYLAFVLALVRKVVAPEKDNHPPTVSIEDSTSEKIPLPFT